MSLILLLTITTVISAAAVVAVTTPTTTPYIHPGNASEAFGKNVLSKQMTVGGVTRASARSGSGISKREDSSIQ